MAEQPLFSIIITSYTTERLKDVFELLDGVKAQTYPNIETIFVAERSTELYEQVKARNKGKNIPNMKILFNEGEPGLSAARNLGIKEATGDIIGFVDDDVLLFDDWAEEMVRSYEDESIIGVTGPAFPLWEGESLSWLPEEFHWIIGSTAWCGWNEMREVRNVWGMNMSFRREAFEVGGLFISVLGMQESNKKRWNMRGAEEVELSLRAKRNTGKRIVYNPKVKVKHRVYRDRTSWRSIARNSYQMIGYSRHMLKKVYPEGDKDANLLSPEYQLLKRIFSRLLPSILKGFFRNPIIAWKKLCVTFVSLIFVALGYCSHFFQVSLKREKVMFHEVILLPKSK